MATPVDDFAHDRNWDLNVGPNLHVRATERPDSPVLERFFVGYDRAFLLRRGSLFTR